MKLLDLYCCAGGASVGYAQAGFEVTGVDIDAQPDYPFTFIQASALDVLRDKTFINQFDVIAASPPCQNETTLTKGNRGRGWEDEHIDMITPTRELLELTGKPYVIENVASSTLNPDFMLCGLTFGLQVFRHRYFEISGFKVDAPKHPSHKGHRVSGWRHGVKYEGDMVAVYGDGGGKGSISTWQRAMGMDWTRSKKHIAEAIPPAYSKFIGEQLMGQV